MPHELDFAKTEDGMGKVVKHHGARLIAEHDPFQVFILADLSNDQWKNLRVVRKRQAGTRSRAWRIAWNGERFARNSDYHDLAQRHPQMLDMVCGVMGAHHAA